MNKRQAGARVARRLRSAEHAVDKAMVETTALIQEMIHSRSEAGFAACVGQSALLSMVRGLNQLAEARGAVVEGHQGLAVVAESADIFPRLEGPLESKRPPLSVAAPVPAAA